MILPALPILIDPYRGPPNYDGSETSLYISWFIGDAIWPLVRHGIRLDELPPVFHEASVFAHMIYGTAGEFTVNGSISQGNWRWWPALERMARKIGAGDLADQLAEAWTEIRAFPEDTLNAYDLGRLIWRETDIEAQGNAPAGSVRRRIVSEYDGERMADLLNYRWTDKVCNAALTRPVEPKGDGETTRF